MNGGRGGMLRPSRALLASDGSPDAALAARAATDLSRKTGAELHVAHAWLHHARGFGYPGAPWTDYAYLYEREARRRIEEQVDAIEAAGGEVARQGDGARPDDPPGEQHEMIHAPAAEVLPATDAVGTGSGLQSAHAGGIFAGNTGILLSDRSPPVI